jgi:hypothetical protein
VRAHTCQRCWHCVAMHPLYVCVCVCVCAAVQVTDAGRIFVRLAGRVSEGEVGFGSEAVGMPAASIRQQAIR